MTIISTVYVPGGIAMAADSRLTGTREEKNYIERFNLSDNEQKLVLLREGTVGLSYTGDAIIDDQTVADFVRRFDIDQVSVDDTVENISEKLNDHLLSNYSYVDINFLVCGFDEDSPKVFKVNKDRFVLANVDEHGDLDYGATWQGDIEATSKILKETPINFSLMPIRDAVDLSEFIVELTIKYGRFKDTLSTCGGDIDLLVITKDRTEFVKHKLFNK